MAEKDGSEDTPRQIIPHDADVEAAVLGAVLLDAEDVFKRESFKSLSPDDFYDQRNNEIFTALVDMSKNGDKVDVVTLKHRLGNSGRLVEVGGIVYLSSLLEAVAAAGHFDHYAAIVKEMSARRDILAIGGQLAEVAQTGTDDLTSLSENSGRELLDIARRSNSKNRLAIDPRRFVHEWIDSLKRRGAADPILTKWKSVNWRLSCGFDPGKVSIIGGYASQGKTTLKINLINHHCDSGFGVVSFSPEMGLAGDGDRLGSLRTSIPLRTFKRVSQWERDFTEEQVREFKDTIQRAGKYMSKNWNLWIVEQRGITIAQAGQEVHRIKEDNPEERIDIVYCDLFDRFGDVQQDAVVISDKLDEVSRIAQETETHWCLLVQIGRKGEKIPALNALYYSGKYEQLADLVFLTWLDKDDGVFNIKIAKQRDGAPASVPLGYDSAFESYTGDIYEPED